MSDYTRLRRKTQREKNRKAGQTSVTCTIYNVVVVFEHGNEPWSVFHYIPSGVIDHFIQQFLAISA